MDTLKSCYWPLPPASPWRLCVLSFPPPCNSFSFNKHLFGTSATPEAGSLHPPASIPHIFSGKISQCVHWFSATSA